MSSFQMTRSYIERLALGLGVMAVCLNAAEKPQISVLTIQTDNVVTYVGDITDPTKLAAIGSVTTAAATHAFTYTLTVGDVTKVNGKPAKGLWSSWAYSMGYSPTAGPGSAISDASQGGVSECKWEIQTADGLLVGRFMDSGLFPHQITGASGIYLGLNGQQSATQASTPGRRASMTEDPSMRRVLGGGSITHTFHFAPAYPPAFEGTAARPEVYHADFRPVTPANPAHVGEALIARASNLGFTTPAVDLGAAFPASARNVVNAPVEVMLNGSASDATAAVGWPGDVNLYRVDFAVPAGTGGGTVELGLRVVGIVSPTVRIAVQ